MNKVNFDPLKENIDMDTNWQYEPLELTNEMAKEYTDNYVVHEWVTNYYDSEPDYGLELSGEKEKVNRISYLCEAIATNKATKEEIAEYNKIYEDYEEERIRLCNWQDVEDCWIDEEELPTQAYECLVREIKNCGSELNQRIFKITLKNDPKLFGVFIYLRDISDHDTVMVFKKE